METYAIYVDPTVLLTHSTLFSFFWGVNPRNNSFKQLNHKSPDCSEKRGGQGGVMHSISKNRPKNESCRARW
jgi:hypothetical protein